tara:strand:- start:1143 stop:1340 length:198 start_codon:yes stop_codon:yes gene_type:complete
MSKWSKLTETNELMLAIEQMVVKQLDANITGHGQMTTDTCEADFNAIIDGKEYIITVEQVEGDDV